MIVKTLALVDCRCSLDENIGYVEGSNINSNLFIVFDGFYFVEYEFDNSKKYLQTHTYTDTRVPHHHTHKSIPYGIMWVWVGGRVCVSPLLSSHYLTALTASSSQTPPTAVPGFRRRWTVEKQARLTQTAFLPSNLFLHVHILHFFS